MMNDQDINENNELKLKSNNDECKHKFKIK